MRIDDDRVERAEWVLISERLLVLEKSESNGEEFVMDALGNFKPMEGAQVGSDMVMLRNFAHNSGKVVLNELETG